MAYIGNIPAESYASFETQTFSTSATTGYTLSHAVTNENEIALFINSIRQQPGSGKSYTASGTSLSLSAATASSDTMYCVYLGRALQTVNPPNASVGADQLASSAVTTAKINASAVDNTKVASTIITGQTAESTIADADTILIHDASASALRKMTKANFVSGVGGANTPAFQATISSTQSFSGSTWTKVALATEHFDTDSKFDNSSNYRFTPTTAGKYFFYGNVTHDSSSTDDITKTRLALYKNGSRIAISGNHPASKGYEIQQTFNYIDTADSDDYYEMYVYQQQASNTPQLKFDDSNSSYVIFGGYRIIT